MSLTRSKTSVALCAATAAGALLTSLLALSPANAAPGNLALNKPVTVSSTESSGYAAAKAVDGSGTTRWASAEGVDNQWIRVDLGAGTSVNRVVLSWEAAYAKAYRVELSDDGSSWRQVYSTSTGDGGTDDLTVSGTGRYLRVYGTARGTAYGYSLFEVEAYGSGGTPTPTPTPTSTPTPTPSPTPTSSPSPGGVNVPFGSHSFPYADGTIKVSGNQAANDAKVVAYYQKWKAAFVTSKCSNSAWSAIASTDADHPYVAEGQGYGLTILATMAGADSGAKTSFDRVLRFVLDHPSVNNGDLHAAEQDASCKSVDGSDSATDGDLEIAYALLLADKQWGSTGTYNYKALAVKRINAIKASEVVAGTKLTNLGDWSSGNDNTMSRSSDWVPGHFKAFRKATGDSAWDGILTAHQNVISHLQTKYAPTTGLLPDFVVNTNTSDPKPAPGKVLESPLDGAYSWNACRDPWRLGVDALTTGDAKSLAAVRKMNTWIKSATGGDPSKITQGYKLNGSVAEAGSSVAFIAPFAVAAATDPSSQAWLDAIWNNLNATPLDPSGYYGASIQLQVMIAITGNHWLP
ncbi:glycosyl hydrolase family 8 [Kitasatospora sp. NBC_00070]|uniref:glycosyl hydrolase family 8 n=1 Tax=Kitasatospora sp. NBC_00070 TaxID=2975962 RepID=UPI003252FCC8